MPINCPTFHILSRWQTFEMKKLKTLIIIISLSLVQCDFFEPIYGWRQFIFKNYTENTYTETTVSAAEIIGDKMIVHHIENIGTISSKHESDFTETKTTKTEKYDEVFLDFIKSNDDKGAFIIDFSDGRKLFIEVGFYGDFGAELNAASWYEIDITEDNIKTLYKSSEINGIPVDDFEIIYK